MEPYCYHFDRKKESKLFKRIYHRVLLAPPTLPLISGAEDEYKYTLIIGLWITISRGVSNGK